MGWTFIASAQGYVATVGATQVSCSSALNVAAGDLLVAWVEWQNAATGDTITVGENDGTDTFTSGTPLVNSNDIGGCPAWLINAPADTSFTVRGTISNPSRRLEITVLQFRPDSGETVTLDAQGTPASGSGTALASNTISTTGTDEVVVGGGSSAGGSGITAGKIGGVAADGSLYGSGGYGGIWYKLYTSTQSNINASATAGNDLWVCNIVSFKSEAAGGGVAFGLELQVDLSFRR